MAKDEERGAALAELARKWLLWLEENELPGLPGLMGAGQTEFALYAGIYKRLERASRPSLFGLNDGKILPNLWGNAVEEAKRFQELRLGVTHVLLVDNPNEDIVLPNGARVGANQIVPSGNKVLTDTGALKTLEPMLDSIKADDATLGTLRHYDLSGLFNRADLVFDDAESGAAAKFRHMSVFDYEAPRAAYAGHVKSVPIPKEIEPRPASNGYDQILALNVRKFREHLLTNATYFSRPGSNSGKYFAKWREDNPRKADRVFQPTKLSDTYMEESFAEFVMKQGDDFLLIDLPSSRHVFQLAEAIDVRRPLLPPRLSVQAIVTIGTPPNKDAITYPVTAIFFHAMDGNDHQPNQMRIAKLDNKGGISGRFLVDYKAYLRWYFGDEKLNLSSDDEAFDLFVDTFFADQSYSVELGLEQRVDREGLFLRALRQEVNSVDPGPIKDRLKELVAWCDESEQRFIFTQGMSFGHADHPREIIGLSPREEVFEWHPKTGHVTSMRLGAWLKDYRVGSIATEVYRGTAGMLPFITLITWGGAVVASGGVLGLGSTLGTVARTGVRALIAQTTGKVVVRKAAKEARPYFVAMLVEAAMSLIPTPKTDNKTEKLAYEFFRGFFEGFGGGAVEHYLTELDDRLQKQIERLPSIAANIATKGGYRAYVIYRKISGAVVKISGIVRALRVVLTGDRARKVADELGRFGQYLGVAFLIILFVIVYLDWVYRSRPGIAADRWVDKQIKSLQWMVIKTGDEIAGYARGLHQELRRVGGLSNRAGATAAVRREDARLTAKIGGLLHEGVETVPAVADFLAMLFDEMGVKDWEELKSLGLSDFLVRGVEALPTRAFTVEQTHKLGAAIGEFVGTIMLERKIVPANVRKNSGVVFGNESSRAIKGALSGGTWRALWRFAVFPFQDIGDLPSGFKKALEEQQQPKDSKLSDRHQRSAFLGFVKELMDDEEELARRIARLADDAGLTVKIETMIRSAAAGIPAPSLEMLTKEENPDWPAEAILFLLYTWLRLGLRQILEAFKLIDDDTAFGGAFKLSDLLEIIGLDLPFDDNTMEKLKTKFSR